MLNIKITNFIKKNNITNLIKVFIFFLILALFTQSFHNPFTVINEFIYLSQPYDIRGITKGMIYILTYLSAILGTVLLIFIKSNKSFYLFLFMAFIFFFIDFFIQFIGITNGFSHDKFSLAVNEAANIRFLISYLYDIIYALFTSLIVIFIIFIIRKKYKNTRYSSKILIFVLIPIILIYFATINVSSIKSSSFPVLFKTPVIILYYYTSKRPIKKRILNKNIQPSNKKNSDIKNIIWIIDESITGSYLSINGYNKKTTPYLETLIKESNDISNYGIVNSVSNCSLTSNLYLRIGLNPRLNKTFKSSVMNLPTIYQYAKRAGYTTWLIDSQAAKDTLQDALTIYDLQDIDNFITYERNILPYKRDNKGIEKIINIQNNHKKNFIVMVKFGSHFPYLLSYDHSNTKFLPVMETTYGGFIKENKEKLINTYLNSLYNNVDIYLKKLLSKLNLKKTILFYTSDHGQNIMENNSKTTHCNTTNIVKNEVTVPLLIFTHNAKKLYPVNNNKHYSQIEIFPTTLALFGYEDNISASYGKDLRIGINKTKSRSYYIVGTGKTALFDK